MELREINKKFDDWWETQVSFAESEKRNLRLAFTAGCKTYLNASPKTYRFRCGKWIVSVNASSLREARALASIELKLRADKLQVPPPARGWHLRQVRGNEA